WRGRSSSALLYTQPRSGGAVGSGLIHQYGAEILSLITAVAHGDREDVSARFPRLGIDGNHENEIETRELSRPDAGDIHQCTTGADDHRLDFEIGNPKSIRRCAICV